MEKSSVIIIEGTCEAHLGLDDSRLIMTCISGQMYDSGPVNVTGDLGARFSLHSSIRNVPSSSKLDSMVVKGVTSGLDALFLTRFGSQRSEYWKTLYSSVGLEALFLVLCSENDDLAPYPVICSFAQQVEGLGGSVRLIRWKDSPHVGKCSSPAVHAALSRCTLGQTKNLFKGIVSNTSPAITFTILFPLIFLQELGSRFKVSVSLTIVIPSA